MFKRNKTMFKVLKMSKIFKYFLNIMPLFQKILFKYLAKIFKFFYGL